MPATTSRPIAALLLVVGATAFGPPAAEAGGRHLCRISRPSGVVMIGELYGYELESALAIQQQAHREALADWEEESALWRGFVAEEAYPVAKPTEPDLRVIVDMTGKSDDERVAARDRERAALDDWTVCTVSDFRGVASARGVRRDHLAQAERNEFDAYARATIRWLETVAQEGEEAAGIRPRRPEVKVVRGGLRTAIEAQQAAGEIVAGLKADRERQGLPVVDPNPPAVVKAERTQWPGLATIYHGVNWGADEAYVTAIHEARYSASGSAEWQVDQCAVRGLDAFVFLWAHEAGTVPGKFRDDDAVLCYYLGDRIKPSKWGTWAALEAAAYGIDPHHPAVFSMSPQSWGGIEVYFPIVRGRAIEYYHYHWDAGRKPHHHFLYLELYRQQSAANGHAPIVRLLETRAEDMRKTSQTVFTSLAYGVRGFQYGGGLFDVNHRDARGVPTPNDLGRAAAGINQTIRAFAPVFERARNVDVHHTEPLPPGGRAAPPDHWVRPVGPELVVGEFADRRDHYLVVANRDAFQPHEATLVFTDSGLAVARMNEESGVWEDLPLGAAEGGGAVKLNLEAAGCDLLRVVGHQRPPAISGPAEFIGRAVVRVTSPCRDGTIHYTLDGSPPTASSPAYAGPIQLDASATVRAVFVGAAGGVSRPVEVTCRRIEPRSFDGKTLGPGVRYDYYEGAWTALPDFERLKSAARGIAPAVSLGPARRVDNYGLRFSGYLELPQAGTYTFTLASDDGARLTIDGGTAIEMDGVHGVVTQHKALELAAGWHRLDVVYFQGVGGSDLRLTCEGPGLAVGPPQLWSEQ